MDKAPFFVNIAAMYCLEIKGSGHITQIGFTTRQSLQGVPELCACEAREGWFNKASCEMSSLKSSSIETVFLGTLAALFFGFSTSLI